MLFVIRLARTNNNKWERRKKAERLKEGIIISKYTLHSKKHKHPVLVLYWSEIWLCKITKNIREVFLCCRFVIVNVDWITSMTDASYAWWLFDYHQHAHVRILFTLSSMSLRNSFRQCRELCPFFFNRSLMIELKIPSQGSSSPSPPPLIPQ